PRQRAQEARPERLRFGLANFEARDADARVPIQSGLRAKRSLHMIISIDRRTMSEITPAQRRRQILDLLATSEGPVSVETLAVQLAVSPVTVRRDLDALERSGSIIRTHGGALINALHPERP